MMHGVEYVIKRRSVTKDNILMSIHKEFLKHYNKL